MVNAKLQSSRTRLRVLLVDDHPLLVQGLSQLINNEPDLEVCGQAEDAKGALDLAVSLKPDLAMVDISLKGSDGIALIKDLKLRRPKLLTLVLSLHNEVLYAERALRAGARGYIMKGAMPEEVMAAIRKVLGGEIAVSPQIASRMLAQVAGPEKERGVSPIERLSDRELEVFRRIGHGQSTKQIADQLHLSIKTIESYRANIKLKLKIATATELIQQAALWIQREAGR